MPYRVKTEEGYVEFHDYVEAELYHAEHGIGEIETFEIAAPEWDKKAYCEEVSKAHSDWYRSIYTRKPDFDYESNGEIAMYLEHPEEYLQRQAWDLTKLWFNSIELLYAHYDEVTAETADIQAFIASLPGL